MSTEQAPNEFSPNPGELMSETNKFSELLLKWRDKVKTKGLSDFDAIEEVLKESGLQGSDLKDAQDFLRDEKMKEYEKLAQTQGRVTDEEVGHRAPEKTPLLEPVLELLPDSNPHMRELSGDFKPRKPRVSKPKASTSEAKAKKHRHRIEPTVKAETPPLTPGQEAYRDKIHNQEYWWNK